LKRTLPVIRTILGSEKKIVHVLLLMKVTYYALLLEAFSACICHVRSENLSIYTFFAVEGLSFLLSGCNKHKTFQRIFMKSD